MDRTLPNSLRSSPSVALAAVGCVLAIAACGTSGKSSGAVGSSDHASFLKFSTCMRAHGVPNFPDPSPGGGIKIAIGAGSGINPLSPVFQSAKQTCKRLLPGGGPPSTVSEAQREAMLANARCMRAHGVLSYPDPTFPSGGGPVRIGPPSGVNPQSPTFQDAAKACAGVGSSSYHVR